MSRLTFSNDTFNCHLECGQCDFIKDDGQRCRNRVCMGAPTCWIHTKRLHGVRIRPSTIENAGKGLFAEKGFDAWDWMCPYGGELIDNACLDARYPGAFQTAPYATELPNQTFEGLDANVEGNIAGFVGYQYQDAACVRGIGSMANGLFDENGLPSSRVLHNAQIEARPGLGLWIRARRHIQQGSEIFVHYGYGPEAYVIDPDDPHETKRRRAQDTRPC